MFRNTGADPGYVKKKKKKKKGGGGRDPKGGVPDITPK